MSYVSITKAIAKHLELYDPTIPKFGPGIKVEKSATQKFITTNWISTNSTPASFGDGVVTLEQGVFRVSCYCPLGNGASDLLEIANDISTHFFPVDGRGLALLEDGVMVRIERRPELSAIMEPDEYFQAHISQDVFVRVYAHIYPQ